MPHSTTTARYFFLSYAHTVPTAGALGGETEHWVRVLFHDLLDRVATLADPTKRLADGFCEVALPPGADRNAQLETALAGAEVFVPLYSPRYLGGRWPQRELESFRRRLAGLSEHRGQRRIVPVLWLPIPSWQRDREIDRAIEFGRDVPNYAEDGLCALRMLSANNTHYNEIVTRLARTIVQVAESDQLGPAAPPVLVSDPPERSGSEAPLVVSVLAPVSGNVPAGAPAGAYGDERPHWRPFGGRQALTAVDSVAGVAERFDLHARIEPGPATGGFPYPTVLLVDPWVLATPGGEESLRRAVADAPNWMTPLVLLDDAGPGQAAEVNRLIARTREILPSHGDNRAYWAHNPTQFASATPQVIAAVCRHYLRNAALFPPKSAGRKPTATGQSGEKIND